MKFVAALALLGVAVAAADSHLSSLIPLFPGSVPSPGHIPVGPSPDFQMPPDPIIVLPQPAVIAPQLVADSPLVKIILNINQADAGFAPHPAANGPVRPEPVQIIEAPEIIPTPVQFVDVPAVSEIKPTPVQIVDLPEIKPTPVQVVEVPEVRPTPIQVVEVPPVVPAPVVNLPGILN